MGKMTFENMTVGVCNRLAYEAAQSVAAKFPERLNCPLLIWGPSGTGKTHLLHAIQNQVVAEHSIAKVVFLNAKDWTEQLIGAIKADETPAFRMKYDGVDLLLLDNLEFFIGKSSTQEEVGRTIIRLKKQGTQIVMASCCAPESLDTLCRMLRAEAGAFLIVDLQHIDTSTIIREGERQALQHQILLSNEDRESILNEEISNFRSLEGLIVRLAVAKNWVSLDKPTKQTGRDKSKGFARISYIKRVLLYSVYDAWN